MVDFSELVATGLTGLVVAAASGIAVVVGVCFMWFGVKEGARIALKALGIIKW